MASLHVIYSSTSGHTEYVIDTVIAALAGKGVVIEKQRAELVKPEDLLRGDVLLLASGTWNTGSVEGQLNPHMYDLLLNRGAKADLQGKKVLLIGLGDERYHFTAAALTHLQTYVESHSGVVIDPMLRIVNEPYGQEKAVEKWAAGILSHLAGMDRVSLKIVGASGQGIISIGEILAKAFKRAGYCVFGYREYNSLIKGGHGSYQIDISDSLIQSSEETVDILISLNHHGFEKNIGDLKDGGVIVHDTAVWEFTKEDKKLIKDRNIRIIYLPVDEIIKKLKTKPILGNVVFSAFVWAAFGGKIDVLKELVGERFASKKDLLETNMKAIDEGTAALAEHASDLKIRLPEAKKEWSQHLLLTGSQAMGLGLVHAGVRLYAGYPMTPSSPLLSYIAEIQNETGMAIKQAEDEITAVQMVSGAMHMGTRAVTATSGGGFDLMTETVSLNGIIENPCVIVLAQRPGPATGLPTWTAQGDLFLAVHGGHGEFSRCVMSVSDSADSFTLMNEAFNIAEQFQTVVIVLTDKHIAEGIYTQAPYAGTADIRRGRLIVKPAELKKLKSTDRYDPSADDGISPRWLPGSEAATYVAQGDEHNADGSVDEGAANAVAQMEKRMKKQAALKKDLPEPTLYVAGDHSVAVSKDTPELDLLVIGWGSTKGAIIDVLQDQSLTSGRSIGYLHYDYLWPLKTERLEALAAKAGKVVLIEGNHEGQLGKLIRMECGLNITDRILKYDGRPFFLNELHAELAERLS